MGAQVIITTLGKLKNYMIARDKIDISELKVVIIDDAD